MRTKFRPRKKTPYGMDDRLPYGQYKDQLVRNVIKTEVKYLHWLWAVCEFEFTQEVWAAVKKQEKEERGENEQSDRNDAAS